MVPARADQQPAPFAPATTVTTMPAVAASGGANSATAASPAAALSTPGESTSPAAGDAAPTAPATPPHAPAQWVRSAAEAARVDGKPVPTPDPYPVEAKRTAALIAEQIPGLSGDRWCFAFQSQGMAGGPWIGPTVEDTLTALHQQGVKAVVLQTIGFLCDHVEILYDIDIAFKDYAANLGIRLVRPQSLNESALLTRALVDLSSHSFARLDALAAAATAALEPAAHLEPNAAAESLAPVGAKQAQ